MQVKCKICGERFNRETTPFKKIGNRYAHKECYDTMSDVKNKKDIKICLYCKKPVDISKEEYAMPRVNRYAHKLCYQQNYNEDDQYIDKIYSYLKSINMKYDFQTCERQRQSYIKKMGYTNKDILLTLKYHFGFKNGSVLKSNGRIGIVPYVHDEALAYYNRIEKTKKTAAKTIQKQLKQEKKVIKINNYKTKKKKDYIDLDSIEGGN